MIYDSFMSWYAERNPDLTKDELLPELEEAYRAGWKRALEVDEALAEIIQLGEDIEGE